MVRLYLIWFFLLLIFQVDGIAQATKQEKPDKCIEVQAISLTGNKITRDNIIFRELEFSVGGCYSLAQLDSLMVKSRQNLLNRSLFNFVTITLSGEGLKRDIEVSVQERWYIWPIPIFQFADRNLNAWIEKGDLNRLNYGLDLRVENFRGRMERLNIIAQTGYDMRFVARWSIPYLTKYQVVGVGLQAGVQYNHEVAYQTVNNKPEYFHSPGDFAQKKFFGGVGFTIRPQFNYLHDIGLMFYQYRFMDTLLMLNPDFSNHTTNSFFQLSYTFKLDFRDYKPYPLSGYYFDIQVLKQGLGLFNGDADVLWVSMAFDQYIPLTKKVFFAYNFSAKLSGDEARPYYLSSGLGSNGLDVRGYELYVVDGQNFSVFKSNLKYELIPQKTYKIPWIKSPKFSDIFFAMYANIFFDLGYASDFYPENLNPLANQVIWGTGVGIDLVSYYDTVIRFEFTLNKQKNTGFFINFVAPI
jgi:outer membrane protein assembly factor BamA